MDPERKENLLGDYNLGILIRLQCYSQKAHLIIIQYKKEHKLVETPKGS